MKMILRAAYVDPRTRLDSRVGELHASKWCTSALSTTALNHQWSSWWAPHVWCALLSRTELDCDWCALLSRTELESLSIDASNK
jgi:hypothetical protein